MLGGFLPSLLWLHFYLRKDLHPEPKKRLIETFALGMLLAPLAIAAQWLFAYLGAQFAPGSDIASSSGFFLWAAFSEEVVKLLAVYYLVIHIPEFDEPVDAMIYLITGALGFAEVENIFVIYKNIPDGVSLTVQILALRTIGATLLHALSSAIVGYFLALAWFHEPHRRKLIWFGVGAATLFHFTFNTLLLNLSMLGGWLSSSAILVVMAILISVLFRKLQMRSQSKLSTVSSLPRT
mgnify:FL=1